MPKAVKETKITMKKPLQQDGDERVGDGNDACVTDTETREVGMDGRTAVLTVLTGSRRFRTTRSHCW